MTHEELTLIAGIREFMAGDAEILKERQATEATDCLTDHSAIVGRNLFLIGWNKAMLAIIVYLTDQIDKALKQPDIDRCDKAYDLVQHIKKTLESY